MSSSINITDLLSTTDDLVNGYLHPKWLGTLPFQNCRICPKDVPLAAISPESIDLMDFCKGGKLAQIYHGSVVRFDTIAYPIPENGIDFFTAGSSGEQLTTDLLQICHREGRNKFFSNGSTNVKDGSSRRIACYHYRCYKKSGIKEKPFKDLALRKNNAMSTAPTSKRTSTGRAMISEKRCNSNFVLNVDKQSYYMTVGTGNCFHENHSPHDVDSISLPKRLWPAAVTEDVQKLGYYSASTRSISTMSRDLHKCNITRRQVSNLAGFAKMAANFQEVGAIPEDVSDPDNMILYFQRREIPHIVLSHHKDSKVFEFQGESMNGRNKKKGAKVSHDNENINTCNVNKNSTDGYVTMEHHGSNPTILADSDLADMVAFGNESRNSFHVPNDQTILISFLWCAPHCRRMFHAFPEVVYIDGTHSTNRERMPLLTVGVRDESFKVHVVIRAFIPNERAWLFRWLFHYGIPTLMGKDACRRIKLIVTDGDSQETSQIDTAINANVYGDAKRRRCGWHIVEKGSTYHIRFTLLEKNMKDIVEIVKKWVYQSLMKDVETADEYQRSKMLLVKFLSHADTVNLIGAQQSTNIVSFLRNYVFPHEDKFAAFHYHNTRSFDEYSNTPLEGTNNALKHCTLGVKGNMPLHHSSANMVQQDSDKLLAKKMELHAELHNARLCDLNGEDGRLISKKAYGQLKQQCASAQNYASLRTSQNTWLLMYSLDENKRSEDKVVPVFSRIRRVVWNSDFTLDCDCGYKSRWGLPCRHMAHVAEFYTQAKQPFTHHDVDIRWWNVNAFFAVISEPSSMDDKELNIRQNLNRIRQVQKYPKVPNIEDFKSTTYAFGTKSTEKFIITDIDYAERLFSRNRSIILNYPENDKVAVPTCSVGITETLYLTVDDSDSESECIVGASNENEEIFPCNNNLENALRAELSQNAKQAKSLDPHLIFGPLYREILLQSKGESAVNIDSTQTALQNIINGIKERKGLSTTKTVKGTVVTCTMANTSEKYTRFQHKKQKLF